VILQRTASSLRLRLPILGKGNREIEFRMEKELLVEDAVRGIFAYYDAREPREDRCATLRDRANLGANQCASVFCCLRHSLGRCGMSGEKTGFAFFAQENHHFAANR